MKWGGVLLKHKVLVIDSVGCPPYKYLHQFFANWTLIFIILHGATCSVKILLFHFIFIYLSNPIIIISFLKSVIYLGMSMQHNSFCLMICEGTSANDLLWKVFLFRKRIIEKPSFFFHLSELRIWYLEHQQPFCNNKRINLGKDQYVENRKQKLGSWCHCWATELTKPETSYL